MPRRIGLERHNMGGRGGDARVAQSAAGAGPIAGKRLFRIEMNVLATEFSLIGVGGGIRSFATESVFVGIGGALQRAWAGALSEGNCWARGKKSERFHETRPIGETERHTLTEPRLA